MDNISHRSTAKAAIRNLVKEHKLSGFLELTAEVLKEFVPARRGRPTLAAAPFHMAFKAVTSVVNLVAEAEDKAGEKAVAAEEDGEAEG